jgi:hypothetical protein
MFWHAWWDPTIIMAAHNNRDILMMPYEDLPVLDKDIISKAIEEFQNKCLLSYTMTRDNKVVQKYPLPRVLMHGQLDTDEANDRLFFMDTVNKYVHDAMLNHNTAFLNTFHNTIKEVFHGYPIDQVGSAYFNIPHPSTQGTNQADTSHQEAALASKDDVQAVQSSSEHVQGITTNQIQAKYRCWLKKERHQFKGFIEILIPTFTIRDFKQ